MSLKIGDLVKITGWPIIAGRGGYGDRGVVEAVSDRSVTIQLADRVPSNATRTSSSSEFWGGGASKRRRKCQ
jgi:hypothetical protein